MKLQITTLILFFSITNIINAQDFQGQAFYSSKMKTAEISTSNDKKSENPEMEKAFKEALEKASQKAYILSFTKNESVFEEEKKLELNKNEAVMVSLSMGGEGKKYFNLKERKQISEGDIFGKEFLVTDEIKNWNWELTQETKKIGDYTCYKAQSLMKATEEEKKEYQEFLKKQETKKSNMFRMSEPKDSYITAWYTTDIPVNFGPDKFNGLPGLILELNFEQITYICTKVVVNPKEKFTIKVPNKGKVINQKEFEKLEKEKFESMKNDDGDVIIIEKRN